MRDLKPKLIAQDTRILDSRDLTKSNSAMKTPEEPAREEIQAISNYASKAATFRRTKGPSSKMKAE
jgi:hypothetical protein